MNFVVTGASGFIGWHLMRHLAGRGFSGIGVSRKDCRPLPPGWDWRPRSEILGCPPGAIVAKGAVPCTLIHLEVKHHVMHAKPRDVEAFSAVNVRGTVQMLEWCAANSVDRFVYFSSIKAVRSSSDPVAEEGCLPNSSPYGASKWQAEQCVREWCEAEPRRVGLILRPAVVYGPHSMANVYSFLDAIAKRRFRFIGLNANRKSMVSITNLCAAVLHLIGKSSPGIQIYNLVDRETYTVRELAQMMAACLRIEISEKPLPIRIAHVVAQIGDAWTALTGREFPLTTARLTALTEHSHFSPAKLIKTGFTHPQSTWDGFQEMVQWYVREQPCMRLSSESLASGVPDRL